MKWFPVIAITLALSPLCRADQAKVVPQEVLDRIVDDFPFSLPRYMTPEEAKIPQRQPDRLGLQPPSGEVYTPAEYELNEGMLIVWGHYNSILTQLAVAVTTGDPDAIMYILVTGSSQQNSCTNTLTSAGADMSQVEFITYTTNTGWIRDYGPRFFFEDGSRAMMDHTYNRPRPLDDAFPDFLAGLWGEPEYDLPLVHGGGNFHLFTNGDAFMSDLILLENPGLSEQDVKDIYADYHNLDLTIYPGFPWNVDGTKHIDMWMQPVDDYKIIIGEYPGDDSYEPHQITEAAVADLEARGYTVYRTPGWNSGYGGYNGTHYTYTNSVVFNDIVFVSTFNGYDAENAQAKAVFEAAFPNHQIIQVNCSDIIHAAGAIHCSMMHVSAYTTTMRVHPGGGLESSGPVGGPFTPDSIIYTVENTDDVPIDYLVVKTQAWVSLTNDSGTIPPGGEVEVTVYINANANDLGVGGYQDTVEFTNLTDHSGDTVRPVTLTVGVPTAVYVFDMNDDPGWGMSGQWAFGQPTGQGGTQYGYPDPASGYTGDNVCGVNLNGDYSTTPGGPYYLVTGALDCSNLFQTSLHFRRWLNSDYQPYVFATLEASADGSDWTMLWQNGGSEITENSWSEQIHDLSAVADGQETVYVRWGYEVGNGAYAYSGWNLDDVEIWGVAADECHEDVNDDGIVDIDDLFDVLSHWGEGAGTYDVNDDGIVDIDDIFAILGAWGPC
ncbi:MAG: agmatine deiminase family protein [Phycisphaerales bacterium]|nr:MAG: agmatine deiminase family protein [Phycisphaerales bacterium]